MSRRLHRVRNLWADIRAVAATEFAIVLPFMLLLWVGGFELGNGLAISTRSRTWCHETSASPPQR
jgi:Flp pilus assembly protein TadG